MTINMKTLQEKKIRSENTSSVLRGNSFPCNVTSNLSGGKPIEMLAVWLPTQQHFKGIKNIIVNPLLYVQVDQQVCASQQDLLCTVNKSSRPRVEGMFTVEDDSNMIQSSREGKISFEPIYAEISP